MKKAFWLVFLGGVGAAGVIWAIVGAGQSAVDRRATCYDHYHPSKWASKCD